MAIIGIVAVARNLAIGKNGKLPWHYSSDLKFFKRTTLHNAVLMGRTTWESIGKRLPKRLNIVLSGDGGSAEVPGVLRFSSKEQVLELTEYLNCDVYIIGGEKTYGSFADEISRWIVTEVPRDVEDADVFMPQNFLDRFELLITEQADQGLVIKTYGRKN